MIKFRKAFVFSLCGLFFAVSFNYSQNLTDVVYELYVQSILYPESFGYYLRENQHMFNQQFHTHLDCVAQRLLEISKVEIERCQQHVDPEWRRQCMQENVGAGLYFWCVSVYQTITEEESWENTWSGSTMIFAKREIERRGVDYVSIIKSALPIAEQQIRTYLSCFQ